jgi:LPS sulfotransferase NodH
LQVRGYAICCQARSGSSYLCELLASTGVLGRPLEYFNIKRMRRDAKDYPNDPNAQLEILGRNAATPNGVYGLKVLSWHFAANRWPERLPALSFVFLTRRDLLGQALSHVRATQTGLWDVQHEPTGTAQYDRASIDEALRMFVVHEARWRYYFARNGIAPLELVYEDLVDDPGAAVAAVAKLVGITPAPAFEASPAHLEIQRDEMTEAWRARYLAEARNLSAFFDLGMSS